MNIRNHFATLLLLSLVTVGATAQTGRPESIKSIVQTEKDSAWYASQLELWKAETQKRPSDETVWRNYYQAWRYLHRNNPTEGQAILDAMKQAIPDSYTYYRTAYYHGQGSDESFHMAEEALKRLPREHNDYDLWTGYLWMTAQWDRLAQMSKDYYDKGLYSPAVLQYNFNELQGMDQDGIIVANGDAALIPKLLLQYGKGLHRDKVIIPYAFLYLPGYREALFKQLGIGDVPEPEEPTIDQEAFDKYVLQLLAAIRQRSHRPFYFSATIDVKELLHDWADSLYNEGLTLKYSPVIYDNRAVKRRNVEKRYLLEYLRESFVPDSWTSGSRLSCNYAVLLADLLPYYKKHNRERYDWLLGTLTQGVVNTSLPMEEKTRFLDLLK